MKVSLTKDRISRRNNSPRSGVYLLGKLAKKAFSAILGYFDF